MKNTHTEYLSSERTPTVYPKLEELFPALSAEEFSALEADILANGCYAPITVNQGMVIVDGRGYRYRESTAFGEFIESGRSPCKSHTKVFLKSYKQGYRLSKVLSLHLSLPSKGC